MAAQLFNVPSRALDVNADPYSGAKAFFYATGTTTPQNVFTTSGLGVAHANPVVADSAGAFPNVYLNADLLYRVIIKNALESVTLHDIDPVNPAAFTSVSGATGSTLVGHTTPLSDVTTVSAAVAVLSGRRSILEYMSSAQIVGCVTYADTTTDHSLIIAAAYADGVKQLDFPAGRINFLTKFSLTANMHWQGAGKNATLCYSSVNDYFVERLTSGARLSVDGMSFTGNTALANSGGMWLFDSATYNIKNSKFADFNREAIRFRQPVQNAIEDTDVSNCGRAISATVTISNASPGIVAYANHGFAANTPVVFTTTGGLPTGLTAARVYYVVTDTANTFKVALTEGGSAINTSSAGSGVHTAYGLPYGGIYFDPGATAAVQCAVRGGYISGCGIGLNARSTRIFTTENVTFESNVIGIKALSSDGKVSGRYFEANTIDIDQMDSTVDLEVGVGENNFTTYNGSAGEDRKIINNRHGFIEYYKVTDQVAGGTGTWIDVSMVTIGDYYQCTATGAEITCVHPGMHEVAYSAALRETTAAVHDAALRVMVDNGSGYVEVEGSYLPVVLAASTTAFVSSVVRVALTAASSKIKLQFTVDDVGVTISSGGNGAAAPTHATSAKLVVSHTGTQ